MAQIVIQNMSEKTIPVQDLTKTLWQHLHQAGIDWMHACGAKGKCTTCMARVLEGLQNMGPQTQAELRYFKIGALQENERLACQAVVKGDVTVAVPDEYKLPHVKYAS
jgi:ferredoxin, 2Fe-2S